MRRVSALKSIIMKNLSDKVIEKSLKVKVSTRYAEKIFEEPVCFNAGDHVVTVEAKGDSSDPDLKICCSCSAWMYSGAEYHAKKDGYLHGNPRGTATKPKKTDPEGNNRLCKHAYAVLRDFF